VRRGIAQKADWHDPRRSTPHLPRNLADFTVSGMKRPARLAERAVLPAAVSPCLAAADAANTTLANTAAIASADRTFLPGPKPALPELVFNFIEVRRLTSRLLVVTSLRYYRNWVIAA
jgi:hypothetical protein